MYSKKHKRIHNLFWNYKVMQISFKKIAKSIDRNLISLYYLYTKIMKGGLYYK